MFVKQTHQGVEDAPQAPQVFFLFSKPKYKHQEEYTTMKKNEKNE